MEKNLEIFVLHFDLVVFCCNVCIVLENIILKFFWTVFLNMTIVNTLDQLTIVNTT